MKNSHEVYHGGQIKRFKERYNCQFLDFSASLNPLAPDLALPSDMTQIREYPDDSFQILKERIAKFHNRDINEIVVGNGSAEIIRSFCHAILVPGDEVNIPSPTFGEYAHSARICGAGININPLRAAATFLCNPNNPTGELCRRSDVLAYLQKIKQNNGILFVDEAFIDLAQPSDSVADVSDENLFIMRSLTKSFAIPGIRFGYGLGSPSLVAKMEMIRPPWSVNAVAEHMAMEAFTRYDDLVVSRSYISRERQYMQDQLHGIDLSWYPAAANFILIRIGKPVQKLCTDMAKKGILIRDCSSFGLPECIRVAVRQHHENELLLESLRQCLQ